MGILLDGFRTMTFCWKVLAKGANAHFGPLLYEYQIITQEIVTRIDEI